MIYCKLPEADGLIRLPLYFGRIGDGRGFGICGGLAGIKGRGASSSRGRLLAQAGAWRTVRRYNDNDPFYRTRRWRHLRGVILRRDGYVCQASRRYGRRVAADTVHHVFPRETFPEYQWESWNLVSLCRAEHDAMHDRNTGSLTNAGVDLLKRTARKYNIPLPLQYT